MTETETFPAPPSTDEVAVEIAEVGQDLMADVREMGEPIEVGTYHFRLGSYKIGAKEKEGAPDPQPYFNLSWTCQDEPYTGMVVFDFCTWITPALLKLVQAGDADAKRLFQSRVSGFKSIAKAGGYDLASLNPVEFFDSNPELRLQIGLRPRQVKDNESGQYINDPSGGMQNKVVKYLAL